jgi:hypothetical protein
MVATVDQWAVVVAVAKAHRVQQPVQLRRSAQRRQPRAVQI